MQKIDRLPNELNKLTEAIISNDDVVLSKLYTTNYSKVKDYILKNSGSGDDAKDIFQEAFIAVWRNVQTGKFLPDSETVFAGYLYKVSKYKWIDFLRKGQRTKVISFEETDAIELNGFEFLKEDDEQYLGSIQKNFLKLGNTCKEVLIKFYYKRLPLKTIATNYNWTEATAKNNKYRCLQQLREFLK